MHHESITACEGMRICKVALVVKPMHHVLTRGQRAIQIDLGIMAATAWLRMALAADVGPRICRVVDS